MLVASDSQGGPRPIIAAPQSPSSQAEASTRHIEMSSGNGIRGQRYASLLSETSPGYPLWKPSPRFTDTGEEHIIQIGDVGVCSDVDPFLALFNITEPLGRITDGDRVPAGVVPHCDIRGRITVDTGYHQNHKLFTKPPGSILHNVRMDEEDARVFTFNLSAEEGALLILPRGGVLRKLDRTGEFQRRINLNPFQKGSTSLSPREAPMQPSPGGCDSFELSRSHVAPEVQLTDQHHITVSNIVSLPATFNTLISHPCQLINELAFQIVAKARPSLLESGCAAFSHDEDWISVLKDSEDGPLEQYELLRRICANYKFVAERDAIYTERMTTVESELVRTSSRSACHHNAFVPVLFQAREPEATHKTSPPPEMIYSGEIRLEEERGTIPLGGWLFGTKRSGKKSTTEAKKGRKKLEEEVNQQNNAHQRSLSDPLRAALLPPLNETPKQKKERLRREAKSKRVSDGIDKMIRQEKENLKKTKADVSVLLLGQSESGKSTTLKQFQLLYSPSTFHAERMAWRAVIYLNLIKSVTRLLNALTPDGEEEANDESISASTEGDQGAVPNFETYKQRLQPLFHLETRLSQLLSSPDEIEPTQLARLSSARNQMNAHIMPNSVLSPSHHGNAHFKRTEVTVHTFKNWKKTVSFANKWNPMSPDKGETQEWWDNPEDLGHGLHAYAPAMLDLWKDPHVKKWLEEKKIRPQESAGL
ncbi:hypothetical protein AAF712_016371 [Marasmius tenuissimus]|uniref:Uncharacterized protein n=1 Tax=Marasmius tenuissimus TaxID=585030 RepID=A0ABR2Z6Q0_9AGAR